MWLIHMLADEQIGNVALEMVDRTGGRVCLTSILPNFSRKKQVRIG